MRGARPESRAKVVKLRVSSDEADSPPTSTSPGLPPPPGQVFEPLPTPLPAGERGSLARDEEEEAETRLPDDPFAEEAGSQAPPPMEPAPTRPAAPVASGPSSLPRPIQQPAPRYPRDAYRRGESGTVLLRVHVGADGEPRGIDLFASSGSRSLDRAAVDAVERWRGPSSSPG